LPKPERQSDFVSYLIIVIFESGRKVIFPHLQKNTHAIHDYWFAWLARKAAGARGSGGVSHPG
jgi:hypothetical protein